MSNLEIVITLQDFHTSDIVLHASVDMCSCLKTRQEAIPCPSIGQPDQRGILVSELCMCLHNNLNDSKIEKY